MKKIFTLSLFVSLSFGWLCAQNQRFIDEVFDEVEVTSDLVYGINVNVLLVPPAPDNLLFDLYVPSGDTCSSRPLAVVLHTGTFLPRGAFGTTGDKDDYANVAVATRLAKRGYVVANVQYRRGWNPLATTDIERRAGIINAAYRSIQDLYTFLRYVNRTVVDEGNPYRVDTDRVAVFGIGTGGFVSLNAAVLTQEEVYIDKFRNPLTTDPFINEAHVGDLHGINQGAINIPNHVGYKDDFHFAFGLDGAVGDSSWLEDEHNIPFAVGGTVTQPTTPYGIGQDGQINKELPVFAAGQFVVNICGTIGAVHSANTLGINDKLARNDCRDPYDDELSNGLRQKPEAFGQEHVWPIVLPGPQTGPWEYWDAAFWSTIPSPVQGVDMHTFASQTNPDMSIDKANRHIDTALWFFAPRAAVALDLYSLVCSCDNAPVPPDTVRIIDDFECHRNTTYGAGADRLEVDNNLAGNSSDDSEKIGYYCDPPNDPWAALCATFDEPLDLSDFNRFRFQVYSPLSEAPLLVKLEGGTSPEYETWLQYSTPGEWEDLVADFSSQAEANHTRICIFPNGGQDISTLQEFGFDNLRLEAFTVSVSPTPGVATLRVSPNPVSDMIYVRNPGDATRFAVVNILGQVVAERRQTGQEIVMLPAGSLLPGLYVVAAYNDQGKLIANARIVKN